MGSTILRLTSHHKNLYKCVRVFRVCTCEHVHMRMSMHTGACMCVCTCMYEHTWVGTHVHVCMYMHTRVCVYGRACPNDGVPLVLSEQGGTAGVLQRVGLFCTAENRPDRKRQRAVGKRRSNMHLRHASHCTTSWNMKMHKMHHCPRGAFCPAVGVGGDVSKTQTHSECVTSVWQVSVPFSAGWETRPPSHRLEDPDLAFLLAASICPVAAVGQTRCWVRRSQSCSQGCSV